VEIGGLPNWCERQPLVDFLKHLGVLYPSGLHADFSREPNEAPCVS
jgi:hypothetical protein